VQHGIALERSGALTEAIDAYRAAAAADPGYAEAYERLGLLYASNGRFDDAAAAYEKAVAVSPKVMRYRIAVADCKQRLGRHDDAIRMYREVMKLDPAAVQVTYKLARSVHESKGAKAALPLYERAAQLEKDNAMPHYFLGYLYKEKGQKARAVAEFRSFLRLKPDAEEKKDIETEIEDLTGGPPK
jgi:tetratricopeptide (TPR) repeat protein